MNIRSSCWATASTFVILLLLAVAVRAQLPSNGEVTGTVVDASGAAIAGANVSLIDRATSTAHGTKTDAAGEFAFRARHRASDKTVFRHHGSRSSSHARQDR